MPLFKKVTEKVADILEYLAIAGVMIMVLINCADVLGSKLFGWPVPGATELISLLQLATLALALGATQKVRGHINVEMFIYLLSERKRSIMVAVTLLFELIIFIYLLKEAVNYGNSLKLAGEVSGTIQIPFYPFAYLLAVCLCPVVVLAFFEFFASLREGFKREL